MNDAEVFDWAEKVQGLIDTRVRGTSLVVDAHDPTLVIRARVQVGRVIGASVAQDVVDVAPNIAAAQLAAVMTKNLEAWARDTFGEMLSAEVAAQRERADRAERKLEDARVAAGDTRDNLGAVLANVREALR